MRISEEYGPQFDPEDGTVGKLQLVKRWAIAYEKTKALFHAREGQYMQESKETTQKEIAAFVRNSTQEKRRVTPESGKLVPLQWWCYPNHFDPVGPVPGHR